jgi:hypothetical protein
MHRKQKIIAILITSIAIVLAIIHLVFPNLKVDAITVTLLIIAIVPWLYPLFKSLEFPGGMKVEFKDFEKVEEEAKEVGLLSDVETDHVKDDYTFLSVASQDPGLALSGLRIEIEKRLRFLAERNNIKTHRIGLPPLLRILSKNQLITREEESILNDMVHTLNEAAHGHNIDVRVADWIIEIGPKILNGLDGKIDKNVEAKYSLSPFNMDSWGHEKSEKVLYALARMVDLINNSNELSEEFKENIWTELHNSIYDQTKVYSFFCSTEWDVNDPKFIMENGVNGLSKIKDRYNREIYKINESNAN